MDRYDETKSLITAIDQMIDDYRSEYDMIKIAEAQYEKLRSLNKTAILQISLSKSVGNVVKNLTLESIWKSPKEAVVDSALKEARSSVLSRAVGPIEELPLHQYMEDSVRRNQVLTHTQVGPEQRLIAKLSQMKGNDWNTIRQFGGIATYLTEVNDTRKNKQLLANSLKKSGSSTKTSIGNVTGFLVPNLPISSVKVNDDNMSNKWYPEGFGTQYGRDKAKEFANEGRFNFKILNLASGKEMSFPPTIENLNESVSPSWNSISLINRSEDLYVYDRADRSFTFDFVIYASTDLEISDSVNSDYDENGYPYMTIYDSSGTKEIPVMDKISMWRKINFLHTLTRPLYGTSGKFLKAPYCKMTIGDFLVGQYCIFDNINIGYEPLLWDVNIDQYGGSVRPMIAKITASGKILHNVPPSVNTSFYG